ncbi:SusD/RagB family nutrient-binding outer membrane lipoprotein [Rapidithrix thailandica]|uniref:SusD/RagB family nutrient-binding outer membrane lipoprotein n=1 Tax=Rapidithrix thailandica TaxID=413964 RepID=A0AAW9S8G5_9BACT
MKIFNYIYAIALVLVFGACQTFDELQLDPNRATEVNPDLILTNLETSTMPQISLSSALAVRQMVNIDGASTSQYYGWQRSSFGAYEQLRQVYKMEQEAQRLEQENYLALAKFFRSFIIINLTQTFGDVPYSEAMAGFEENYTPVYDRQKDIYAKVVKELKEANEELDANKGEIAGDVVYGGDILQWKKMINSFRLRILISLSHKEGWSEVDVEGQFKEMVENPDTYPIFTDNADNFALTYHDLEGNRYPLFNNNGIQTAYYMEESFINHLKDRQDPRLFKIAEPDQKSQDAGLEPTDFDAYSGLKGSETQGENSNRINILKEGSQIHPRYYQEATNEPSVVLSYAEVEFTLAEAAARGWIAADAEVHYQKGIKASMEFYGIEAAAITAYQNQAEVMYDANKGLEMILTQKYLAMFLNSGWEPFYNQRRTGIPEFDTSGGGMMNNSRIPKRWMYPQEELNLNTTHAVEAIQRQFDGNDHINAVMWILKPE